MRKSPLLTATALGLALSGGMAQAVTTISTAVAEPVATSTAGDTTVTSDGSITLTSGAAITLDSDNSLDFEGDIEMSASASGSTGILITDVPDRTQALTLTGSITVTDDYTADDTTSADGEEDGYTDAPWAEGTGRYGVHSTGASPFTGDVSLISTSVIVVDGNDSYGIRFENLIDGNFTFDGTLTTIGDTTTGIALDKGVTGNVYLSGSIGAFGENARAVTLTGDVGGSLVIDGTYSSSAYSSISSVSQDVYENFIPEKNLLQGGPLVTIAGNVADGVLLGSSVTGEDDDVTDEDGDGLADSVQTTAALATYSGSPALLIGSESQDITLGGLTYADSALDPPSVNYGLLIRGSVAAYGVHPGIDSNAVILGGTGHTVTVDNGIGIAGAVSSATYGGDTTALLLDDGTTTPRLDVSGSIGATTTRYLTSTETDDGDTVYTVANSGKATAVSIAAGASLPTLLVSDGGGIYAASSGSTGSAAAIVDRSDTLTSITNRGSISATITATDDDGDGYTDTVTGQATAIDVSGNTAGLTLTQTDIAPDDDDVVAPYIYGKILLGSGNDIISSSGGVIYGDIDYGAGTGSFSLADGAAYLGKMTSAGEIAMDIDGDSTAGLYAGSSVRFSSLHVGDGSTLGLNLQTDAPSAPLLIGSGAAVFNDGAKLYLSPDDLVISPTRFTLLTAGSIDLGDITTETMEGHTPYLYHAELLINDSATTLYADFRLRTQAEGGYLDNQYAALMPVLAVVDQDSGAQSALLGETGRDGFFHIYNQYLPDYSGENLLTLAQGAASVGRSLGNLTVIPDNDGGQYWMQEYGYHTERASGDVAGFSSTGVSFSAGRERAVYGNQMIGSYISVTSASPRDTYAIGSETLANSDLIIGSYWRISRDGVKAWFHAGAGYASFESTRNLLTDTAVHTSTAKWNGYSLSAGAGASYDIRFGKWAVTPQWSADYYSLKENGYSESGGDDYFDLTVGKREGHLLSSTARLGVGYQWGFVKPELWVGYKQNVSATLGDTVANFAGGDVFTLTGGNIEGGGPLAGLRISADNPYSYFALEAEYGEIAGYKNTSVSLRTRFQF